VNFVTVSYAVFLPAVFLGYWLLPARARRPWLIASSLVFYASWNALYVPGFVILIVANWWLAFRFRGPRARLAFGAAIALDLGVLAVFKYLDFVIGSGAGLLALLAGRTIEYPVFGLVLPLAISFVTFTQLAYVIDVWRGRDPERSLERFAVFILFFPHLIAGPIMRASEFLPQVHHPRPFTLDHIRAGIPKIATGLLKKSIADVLAIEANRAFGDPAGLGSLELAIGLGAFTFQILLDFSGYTDIALGSARLLGFQLPENFSWPYRSGSAQEFWRRWHMTLSRWLRDYLYFTLGGSRHGPRRTYIALMVTMLLGGLWHGAGITFLIWGGWHGLGLAVHRWYRGHLAQRLPIPTLAGWAMTFVFVALGWIVFRAATLSDALAYLGGLFSFRAGEIPTSSLLIGGLVLAFIAGQWVGIEAIWRLLAPRGSLRRDFAYGLGVAAAVFLVPASTISFIYFQF